MPQAPRKICKYPNCGQLTTGTYCEKHEKKKQEIVKVERIKYDKVRGTASSRGYTYRWSQYSKQYRLDHPLCVRCEKEGRITLATCVDHITPVKDKDDPLFWEVSNHQGLCDACHNIKSEAEGNRFNSKERFV